MMLVWLLLGCTTEAPTITVLAASSLTEVMADLKALHAVRHPDVQVTVSTAGSQTLATQVRHGLPADLFASASLDHLTTLADEGYCGPPTPFATNTLVLAVSTQREAPVTLETLPTVDRLVMGADAVPVGRYTRALLDAATDRYGQAWRAGLDARIVSRELSARHVLSKVARGEADAAIVYATDVESVDGVRAISLPPALLPDVRLAHAVITGGSADTWLELVASPQGEAVLRRRGFGVAR